jgi:release factor glutamine methyltransferase
VIPYPGAPPRGRRPGVGATFPAPALPPTPIPSRPDPAPSRGPPRIPDGKVAGRGVPIRHSLVARLAAAGCVAPDEEADDLLAAAPDRATLESWLTRREQGEPLAWLTGSLVFCGRPLAVAPGVYVPRLQTEELARRAARLLPPSGSALDLCTGAGALAAHLMAAHRSALVLGLDLDPIACACSRANGVPTVRADLAAAPFGPATFDLVTAVAPYVPTPELRFLPADVQRYEPARALDGGPDGLDLVRRVVTAGATLLRPSGWLLLELGADQDQLLAPALAAASFAAVVPWHDEDGDLRGLAARLG